jgi:hypothetical protein
MEQKAGTAATLSIFAALGSFILSFSGHPGWGLIAALAAFPLGFFGLLRAASPRVGGGIMSIIALVLGLLAIGVAILVLIGVIIF